MYKFSWPTKIEFQISLYVLTWTW